MHPRRPIRAGLGDDDKVLHCPNRGDLAVRDEVDLLVMNLVDRPGVVEEDRGGGEELVARVERRDHIPVRVEHPDSQLRLEQLGEFVPLLGVDEAAVAGLAAPDLLDGVGVDGHCLRLFTVHVSKESETCERYNSSLIAHSSMTMVTAWIP